MADFTKPIDLPSVNEVVRSSLAEHPEFYDDPGTEKMEHVAAAALANIAILQTASDKRKLSLSDAAVADIGTIWIHSGTGSYDSPVKGDDNPRIIQNSWAKGFDRARTGQAIQLARRIAELRSDSPPLTGPLSTLSVRTDRTTELIREFGPHIFYSGYRSETTAFKKLFDRPGMVVPPENVHVLDTELKVTADAVRTFIYPEESKDKAVAVVSHAPHLGGRILHMMQQLQPLSEGSIPYLVPVATPAEGRHDFALMETRGLLYYIFGARQAAETPHPYRLLT